MPRRLALLAVTALAIGCGPTIDLGEDDRASAPPTTAPVLEGYTAVTFENPYYWFGQVLVAPRFDGAVMRRVAEGATGPSGCTRDGGSASYGYAQDTTTGYPCATAHDEARCRAELTCAWTSEGWHLEPSNGSRVFFVFVERESPTIVTSRADLVARVGPIDSAPKAFLLVLLDRGTDAKIAGYRAYPDRFEVLVRRGPYSAPSSDELVGVASDGTLTEIERHTN